MVILILNLCREVSKTELLNAWEDISKGDTSKLLLTEAREHILFVDILSVELSAHHKTFH